MSEDFDNACNGLDARTGWVKKGYLPTVKTPRIVKYRRDCEI